MEVKSGTNRIVFVFKNSVIKIPNFRNGMALFLHGMKANLHEAQWWKDTKHRRLAEVYSHCPFGFWIRMERLWHDNTVYNSHVGCIREAKKACLPVDPNDSNFGYSIKDKMFKMLDYGD